MGEEDRSLQKNLKNLGCWVDGKGLTFCSEVGQKIWEIKLNFLKGVFEAIERFDSATVQLKFALL